MSTCLAIGKTILGPIAWMEPYWRHLILIIYLPLFVFVIYFWIAPESVRWLISKGRYQEALDILKEAAEINGRSLREKTINDFKGDWCLILGNYWLSLSVYLIGKMCIAGVASALYVYTAELFPTRYRSSLLSYCSMIGRVGGILAPLMPGLAAVVWLHLPFLVFGVLALVSGLLVLLAPETLGAPLPDSMEEAAELGKEAPTVMQHLRTLVFRSKSYTIR
ncbi:solute carrier family 22 member 6-like [Cydia amplana]|uniref:solute carrier family 22 member 6-like n=1 Tax=Cydia amplana TaxID=1869771 RepID=UPI002FE5B5DD